ncbi:MAG TPA: hypothetical protein VGB77_00270 [Abditibacteriaceae bacterium]|jgi:hypothetical protein
MQKTKFKAINYLIASFVLPFLIPALIAGCGGGATLPGNGGNPTPTPTPGPTPTSTPVNPPAGQLSAYEGFNYSPDAVFESLQGGSGFSSQWRGSSEDTEFRGFANIEPGSLNINWLKTTGNHVEVQGNGLPATFSRTLNSRLGVSGTTVWMSFVFNSSSRNTGGVMVGTLTADPNRIPPGALLIGDPTASDFLGLEHSKSLSSPGPTAASTTSASTQALLVVRMRFANGVDTFDLFVNPPLNGVPPATPNATLRFDLDTGGGDVTLMANGAYSFDEIRFGSSFAAVTPAP